MERRALLAIVLSVLIILGYQWYAGKFYPQTAGPPLSARSVGQIREAALEAKQSAAIEVSPPPLPVEEEKETVVETERFIITFTNVGGAVKKIELKDYLDPGTKEPLELVRVEDPRYNIGAISRLHLIPDSDVAIYNFTKIGDKIVYRHAKNDFAIEKIYTLHNSLNHIELWIKLENLTGRTVNADYKIIGASSITQSEPFESRYVKVSSKVNGKIKRAKKDAMYSGEISWVALNNKYFSILLKPYQFGSLSFTERIDKNNLAAGLKTSTLAISAGSEVSHQYLYYIGPINIPMLKEYGMGLEESVDYGVFGGISILLLNILKFFYKIFHNWGVSIVCVTLLINLILYPLSKKSYTSMRQIQELQPHMEKLRQIHKDSPHKLQKEMMELYKKYKVNPMGGCLPLFLQMPIIFAMYQTIMRSIELKGANFLWIKDLSQPDAVPLPFSLPFIGNSINMLPLFMVIAMIIQQKFSPLSRGQSQTEQQKQQQQMMLFMPIIFGVIFYSLPSGLVLYWLINTILMMVNQYRVMKKTPALIDG